MAFAPSGPHKDPDAGSLANHIANQALQFAARENARLLHHRIAGGMAEGLWHGEIRHGEIRIDQSEFVSCVVVHIVLRRKMAPYIGCGSARCAWLRWPGPASLPGPHPE